MSGRLSLKVWQSSLDPRLKPLAALMVLYGHEDGTSIHPAIGRLAQEMGKAKRYVQQCLAELRAQKLFIPDEQTRHGGRHLTVCYRFDEAALPAPFPIPRKHPKNTTLSPPIKDDPQIILSEVFEPPQKDDPQITLSKKGDLQMSERVIWEAQKGDLQITRSSKIFQYEESTNTSTDAVAPVSPTTTERRRKPPAKIRPTFATMCVFVADFLKRAEPGLSDPDLLEDIRNACQRTFDTYDSVQIRDALENVRREAQRLKSPGARSPSRMTHIADLLPRHLARIS